MKSYAWKWRDKYDDTAFGGFTLDVSIDSSALETFAAALVGQSDAQVETVSITETVISDPGDLSLLGDNGVEFRGQIQERSTNTGQKHNIGLPSLSSVSTDWNGTAPVRVASAAVAVLHAAYIAMVGSPLYAVRRNSVKPNA